MDDIYYKVCDRVEDIQKDIDEVDTYLNTIKKLKKSKFNPHNEDKALTILVEELTTKRKILKDKWQVAYDSLLTEADCIVESFCYAGE